MSRSTVTVYYRSDCKDSYAYGKADITNPACLVIREDLNSYGGQRSTFIPWDLIDRVVVE